MVGAFVVPLLTIYLMGSLTAVHRRSAVFGLIAGVGYGICYLVCRPIAEHWNIVILVPPLTSAYAAYPISMLFTAGVMILFSLAFGWESAPRLRRPDSSGWLQSSRRQIQDLVEAQQDEETHVLPTVLGIIVVAVGIVLSFVVFW
jgi:hypothetical protein